jgi:putative effector of murein hydrolase
MTAIATPATQASSLRLGRSLLALFAGLFLNVALSTATDVVLSLAGVFPALSEYGQADAFTNPMLALALLYRTLFGVLGCYVTARLAPRRPMFHSLTLGAIGFAIGVVGAITMWNGSTAWYAISITLVALPAAWLAGVLVQRRSAV